MTLDAYCSNLNTRLIAAFDAIDAVRLGHKQELEDLQRRIHILHARCRALKHQVKFAEAERDELREGVERLIEKGGTSLHCLVEHHEFESLCQPCLVS